VQGLTREGPFEGLGHGAVEIVDEGEDAVAQGVLRGEVSTEDHLADEDAQPDFDLMHPGAVDGREVAEEARMSGKPGTHEGTFVHLQMVQDEVDLGDGLGNLRIEVVQQGQELDLPFARGGASVDTARAGVEGGKEVEGTIPVVLVFDLDQPSR